VLPSDHIYSSVPGRERFYRQHIEPNRWLRVEHGAIVGLELMGGCAALGLQA
jgi:hypothetical protein